MPAGIMLGKTIEAVADLLTEDTLIELWPTSVWFRKIITGSTIGSETITIHNPSAVDIEMTSYINSNSAYDVVGLPQPTNISAGHTITFTLEFDPTSGGSTNDTGELDLIFDNGQTKNIGIWSSKYNSAVSTTNITTANDRDLNVADETYILQNDVSTSGTAFNVSAANVSLDLNGYNVTYGTGGANNKYGIFAASTGNGGKGGVSEGFHVYSSNGMSKIIQDDFVGESATGDDGYGAYFEGQSGETDIEIGPNLTFQQYGKDGKTMDLHNQPRGFWIHDCVIECKVTDITSRHQFDGYRIHVHSQGAGTTPTKNRYHDLTFTGSPQGCITEYGGGGEEQIYDCYFDNDNRFANGFAIQTRTGGEAFNNTINNTSGRGIFIRDDNVHVHDNNITIRGLPQVEEPPGSSGVCEAFGNYGIQFESGMDGARVYKNNVVVLADTCQVVGIKITEAQATGDNILFRNTFDARKVGAETGNAFAIVTGSGSFGEPDITNNTFISDQACIDWDYSAGVNSTWRNNTFRKGTNPDATVYWNRFRNGNPAELATGHRFIDCTFENGIADDVNDDSPITGSRKKYSYYLEWTLSINVNDAGAGISGATITIDDNDGTEVFNSTSDSEGDASTELIEYFAENTAGSDRVVNDETDHDITIVKSGYTTVNYTITMDATKSIDVDMDTGVVTES